MPRHPSTPDELRDDYAAAHTRAIAMLQRAGQALYGLPDPAMDDPTPADLARARWLAAALAHAAGE